MSIVRAKNPNKRPVILANFPIGELWVDWVNLSPGIWYTDFNGTYSLVDPELTVDIDTKQFDTFISIVQENGVILTEVFSITELSAAPSWYYDRENRILYIRLSGFNQPYGKNIKIGVSVLIANETYIDEENSLIYAPDLKNIPPLTQSKDRLFFKKLTTLSFQMKIDNGNLTYDGMKDWDVYNQPVQYYFGYHDQLFSEFVKIRKVNIKDFSFIGDEVAVNVIDPRDQFTARIPQNTFTVGEYPDLQTGLSGKPIPLSFGPINRAPITLVNGDDASGPYVYKIADESWGSIKSVDTVYVDRTEVTPSNIDLDEATFELTSGQVKDGDNFLPVTCTHQGYVDDLGDLIENPLDQVELVLETTLGIPFNDIFYNTSEWNAEKTDQPNTARYIASKIQIKTLLQELQTTTGGGFFTEGDGRLTFRTRNVDAPVTIVINDEDWKQTPGVEVDTDEILSFVQIGYNKNYDSNSYQRIENTEFKTQVEQSFNVYDDETFNTLLVLLADADAAGDEIMSLSNSQAIILTGEVGLEYINAEIGKNFQAEVNRFVDEEYQEWYGTLGGEILVVAPDILNNKVKLTLRVIDGVGEETEDDIAAIYGEGIYGEDVYGDG